jgi:selenocysteine lyase/cysteine desulfurase
MPGLQAFRASLELLLECGPAAVSARILDRAQAVRDLALSAGWSVHGSARPDDLSGIVALEKDGIDYDALVLTLRAQGIALSARRGRLRISPHIYNNSFDLSRLSEALLSAR